MLKVKVKKWDRDVPGDTYSCTINVSTGIEHEYVDIQFEIPLGHDFNDAEISVHGGKNTLIEEERVHGLR